LLDTFQHKGQRKNLVATLEERGITDERVLTAIGEVPRHIFVPPGIRARAYEDRALPIHEKQTISQPFTVAYMTELLKLDKPKKVLEVGTGSGYQAAILAAMGMRVFSVERHKRLLDTAREVLDELGYAVNLRKQDGSAGWSTHAPFDRIIVTAASPSIPDPLKQQLTTGGIMVIPVGTIDQQQMCRVTRLGRTEYRVEKLRNFQFVPLLGRYGFQEENP